MMRLLAASLLYFFAATALLADEATYRRGDWVIVVRPGVQFERDGSFFGQAELGNAYAVDKQDEDRLWIRTEQGYLDTSDVVHYTEAMKYFTRWIEDTPESPLPLWARATFLYKKGQYEQSISDFDRALEMAPDAAVLYIGRGNALRRKQEFKRAAEDFEKAVKLSPDALDSWNGLGLAKHGLKKYEEAIQHFERAIEIDPNRWYPWNNRGNSYVATEDHKAAIPDFTEAIRLDPQDPVPIRNRANAYWKLGEYAAALEDFEAAIKLNPNYTLTFISRGDAFQEIGRYADALQDYTLAIRYQPMRPEGFISRGWLLATCPDARFRDGALALSDATILCGRTNYSNPRSLDVLAAALAELGRYPEACKWQRKALELVSDEHKADYQEPLDFYERNEPYRLLPAVPRPPIEALR